VPGWLARWFLSASCFQLSSAHKLPESKRWCSNSCRLCPGWFQTVRPLVTHLPTSILCGRGTLSWSRWDRRDTSWCFPSLPHPCYRNWGFPAAYGTWRSKSTNQRLRLCWKCSLRLLQSWNDCGGWDEEWTKEGRVRKGTFCRRPFWLFGKILWTWQN